MFFISPRLVLLLVMQSTTPLRSNADAEYREEIADAVIGVTDNMQERLLLVRIAGYESLYSERVATCNELGYAGNKSRGLWQVSPRSEEESQTVCGSLEEQAQLALERIRESLHVCRYLAPQDRLGIYTHGKCFANNKWSRARYGYAN